MRRPLGRKLYYSIGEVSELTQLQPYTLRAWEKEFSCLRPRRVRGKNRAYRERDIGIILLIKRLLYEERYSTKGVRQKLKRDPELIQRAVEAVAKLTTAPRGSALDFALGPLESDDEGIEPAPVEEMEADSTGRDDEETAASRPSSGVDDPDRSSASASASATAEQRRVRVEEIVQDLHAVIKLLT